MATDARTGERDRPPVKLLLNLSGCHAELEWRTGKVNLAMDIQGHADGTLMLKAHQVDSHRSVALEAAFNNNEDFKLTGTAPTGEAFSASYAWVASLGETLRRKPSPHKESGYRLRIETDELTVTHPPKDDSAPDVPPFYRYSFEGFRCGPRAAARFDAGLVTVSGPLRITNTLGGEVTIEPAPGLTPSEVDECAQRVLDILSFASGRPFDWSLRERLVVGGFETVWRGKRPSYPVLWPTFHHIALEELLLSAGRRYTRDFAESTGLALGIRWHLAHSNHEEVRFIQRMIALEHLVDQRGRVTELIPKRQYAALKKRIIDEIDSFAAESPVDAASVEEIKQQIAHLNKRALKKSINGMLLHYDVPADDLAWPTLVDLRNQLVHTGTSADPTADVVDADARLHELLTRMVLRMLGYEGGYRTWLSGHAWAHLPPRSAPP